MWFTHRFNFERELRNVPNYSDTRIGYTRTESSFFWHPFTETNSPYHVYDFF